MYSKRTGFEHLRGGFLYCMTCHITFPFHLPLHTFVTGHLSGFLMYQVVKYLFTDGPFTKCCLGTWQQVKA